MLKINKSSIRGINMYQEYNNVEENFGGTSKRIAYEEVIAKTYIFMMIGLLITAFAAFTISPNVVYKIFTGNYFFFIVLGELAIVMISNWALRQNKVILAGILYVVYAYLTGIIFSLIFMLYTASSLVSVFAITASVFFVMSIYGLFTKRDLTSVGNMSLMALLGIMIASIVNMIFLKSSMFDLVISCVVVLVFVLLVAYDSQKIKNRIAYANDNNILTIALCGAFELYLDFINILLRLIRIFGKRK